MRCLSFLNIFDAKKDGKSIKINARNTFLLDQNILLITLVLFFPETLKTFSLFILKTFILGKKGKILVIEITHAMTYKKPHNYFFKHYNRMISLLK